MFVQSQINLLTGADSNVPETSNVSEALKSADAVQPQPQPIPIGIVDIQDYWSNPEFLEALDFMVVETQKQRREAVIASQPKAAAQPMRRAKYSIAGGPSFDLGYDFGTPSFEEEIERRNAAANVVSDLGDDGLDIGDDLLDVNEVVRSIDMSDGMGCSIQCGVSGVDYDCVSEFMISNKEIVSGMKLLRKQIVDYFFSDYAIMVNRYFSSVWLFIFVLLFLVCYVTVISHVVMGLCYSQVVDLSYLFN